MLRALVCGFIFTLTVTAFAKPPENYPSAKKIAQSIFLAHSKTLYCACQYDDSKAIDLDTCNMGSAKTIPRARQIEWEHIVPAYYLGKEMACWQEKICTDTHGKAYKGRKCCEKMSKEFRLRESELFNLWPSVGAVNNARANYLYTQFYPDSNPSAYNFNGCPIIIDKPSEQVEPSDEVKGVVARGSLFMAKKHKINLPMAFIELMSYWDAQFPPDRWEYEWDEKVAAIEGYHNDYIIGHLSNGQ